MLDWDCHIVSTSLLTVYRPYAADVRRLNFPDIYRIMTFFEWQKTVVSLQKKRTWNHEQTICCSIPIGNYQTVEIHRLSACSRENAANNGLYYTVLYSILPLKMADSPYISVLDDITTQGLLVVIMARRAIPIIAFPRVRCMFI